MRRVRDLQPYVGKTLEDALRLHTCELERTFGFQAREMLFSARMCVSHEFQRYIPRVTT